MKSLRNTCSLRVYAEGEYEGLPRQGTWDPFGAWASLVLGRAS